MWSIALYDFGLTEEKFWRLTFRQFYMLSKRFNAETVRLDFHFATINATLYNCHRDPKKRKTPFQPSELMPERDVGRKLRKTQKALHDYWKSNVLAAFKVTKKVQSAESDS